MVVNINDSISSDTLDKILVAFNQLKDNETLDLYLCSPGGDVQAMEAIISFLSRNGAKINLFGYGDLSSAAFIIFFKAECPKDLLPGTTGMAHLATIHAHLMGDPNNWKNRPEDKAYIDWAKELKKYILDFASGLGLTEDEMNRLKKAEDVYFMPKRMYQLFKNHTK